MPASMDKKSKVGVGPTIADDKQDQQEDTPAPVLARPLFFFFFRPNSDTTNSWDGSKLRALMK